MSGLIKDISIEGVFINSKIMVGALAAGSVSAKGGMLAGDPVSCEDIELLLLLKLGVLAELELKDDVTEPECAEYCCNMSLSDSWFWTNCGGPDS